MPTTAVAPDRAHDDTAPDTIVAPPEREPVLLRGHVIPNSHLDREWTLEFQQTRRLTVEFLDRLLEIFDQVPEYTFLLDSQTVPLEDYLEIRPENEGRLKALVQAGRLCVGPWYTAPDCNTISGESIIRNLLVGHRIAAKFGRVMKTGYTPFGFGQVSQFPQIYAGFGIDVIFFYRGITHYESGVAEFYWKSPDGTTALCSRFGSKARYNFFMDVWRPVVYGREFTERLFDWRRGGLPFKRVDASREYEHYFVLRPKLQLHLDRLETAFRQLIEKEKQLCSTPVIALMQGMDTSKPDPLEAELVRQIQKFLQPGEKVFFSTLEAYANELKQFVDPAALKTFEGEMRKPGPPSPLVTNLEHTASSRPRQRIAQAKSEAALIRLAEPFAAAAWLGVGAEYPKSYLDLAWKYLLKCHPHDTICGTGVDKLEMDALYALSQVRAISDVVLDDALGAIQCRINNSSVAADELALTIFNPSPRPRSEVVDAYIDTPHDCAMPDFEILDSSGKPADWCFVYRKPSEKTVRDNTDLTNALLGWNCKVQVRAENVPALGYRSYTVRRCDPTGRKERVATSPHHLENEYLVVTVNPDGTLDISDKHSGHTFKGVHYLVDSAETGQGWESRGAGMDELISSRGSGVAIALVENTPLSATVRIRYTLRVPTGLIHDDSHHFTRRGEREEDCVVESLFTLRRGARRVDVHTTIDNRARNHRIRAYFPTGLAAATHSYAETPCDVVERVIDRAPDHPYSQAINPMYPCLRFAGVSDGSHGLGLITEGIHEYEVTDDPSRTLILTLMRAYEITLCTVSWRWERRPDQPLSQVPGAVQMRYAIVPHTGTWKEANLIQEAEDFQLPLIPAQAGRGEGDLPRDASLLEIRPASLVLSALKRAEDRADSVILRLYNPLPVLEKAQVVWPSAVREARIVTMNEEPVEPAPPVAIEGNSTTFEIGAKKILTLEVWLKARN
jgi:alpha-mannosidase